MNTFSTAEVAQMLCGDSMKEPERWVVRQIVSGRFDGIRVGRHWRMTEAQVQSAIVVLSAPKPRKSSEGLSARSRRMRVAS